MAEDNLCKDKWKREETLKSLQTSMSLNYVPPESSVTLEKQQTPQGTDKLL